MRTDRHTYKFVITAADTQFYDLRIWGFECFESLIFELQNGFLTLWVWYKVIIKLRCINPAMSCLVMHRNTGDITVVVYNEQGRCWLYSGTRHIRSIVDWAVLRWKGILVVGYWDIGVMCAHQCHSLGVAPYEASRLDSSDILVPRNIRGVSWYCLQSIPRSRVSCVYTFGDQSTATLY